MMLFIVACSKDTTETSPSQETTTTETATSEDTETEIEATEEETDLAFEKYEELITLTTVRTMNNYVIFDSSNPDQASLTENIWASAYKDYLNVEFDYLWTSTDDDYAAKWNTAIASGDIPDCAVVDASIYKVLLEADLVEDMTDYFNDYASDDYA